jgi:Kef-type K+ transport system membrane component KefB
LEVNILLDIGLVIIFATIGALLARFIKQPLLIGYILAGVIIGPSILGLIKSSSLIATLSELGIAFLLFFIGLEFDITKIKKLGPVVSMIGFLQVLLITVTGALISSLWLDIRTSVYIGLVLAFSSTMIVVKLILDKKEIDTLHGRIILGLLLIQDVIAIIILPFLPSFGSSVSFIFILKTVISIIILFTLVYLLQKFIFKHLLRIVSENTELLFIISLSTCFLFLGLAYIFNFSLAIGGFLAGLAVASQPYNIEIAGKIKSLKDFFAVLFFVSLGTQLTLEGFNFNLGILLVCLLIIVILLKPFVIFFLLKAFRYSNRVALLSSSSLAQISEFSLVLAAIGLSLNHISQDIFNLIIIIAIISIILTGYLIKFDERLYSLFSNILIPLEKLTVKNDLEKVPKTISNHIVLFGADRMGSKIAELYEHKKDEIIIVDFNPEIVKSFLHKGYNCVYGDYGNQEVLEILQLHKARLVISTIPSVSENILVIDLVKSLNKKAVIIVTARANSEALTLYEGGADFVVLPEVLAGQRIVELMKHKNLKQTFANQGQEFKKSRRKFEFID